MFEISPNYYAAGVENLRYELSGVLFDSIPNDAVGVLADDNNEPLAYVDTSQPSLLFSISEKTANRMVATQNTTGSHGSNTYLGAIVSSDRQTIYWVNETNPLP